MRDNIFKFFQWKLLAAPGPRLMCKHMGIKALDNDYETEIVGFTRDKTPGPVKRTEWAFQPLLEVQYIVNALYMRVHSEDSADPVVYGLAQRMRWLEAQHPAKLLRRCFIKGYYDASKRETVLRRLFRRIVNVINEHKEQAIPTEFIPKFFLQIAVFCFHEDCKLQAEDTAYDLKEFCQDADVLKYFEEPLRARIAKNPKAFTNVYVCPVPFADMPHVIYDLAALSYFSNDGIDFGLSVAFDPRMPWPSTGLRELNPFSGAWARSAEICYTSSTDCHLVNYPEPTITEGCAISLVDIKCRNNGLKHGYMLTQEALEEIARAEPSEFREVAAKTFLESVEHARHMLADYFGFPNDNEMESVDSIYKFISDSFREGHDVLEKIYFYIQKLYSPQEFIKYVLTYGVVLTVFKMCSNSTDQCAICLDDEEPPNVRLNCNHGFHFNCVKHWVFNVTPDEAENIISLKNNTCPICRFQLRLDVARVFTALYN